MIAYDAYLKTLFRYLINSRIKANLFAKMIVRLPMYYKMSPGTKKKLRLEYFDNKTKPSPDKFLPEPSGFPSEYKKENVGKIFSDVASIIQNAQEEYYEAKDQYENAQLKVREWEDVYGAAGSEDEKGPQHPGAFTSMTADQATKNGKWFKEYIKVAAKTWSQIDEAWQNDAKIIEYPDNYFVLYGDGYKLKNIRDYYDIETGDALAGGQKEDVYKRGCNVMWHIMNTELKHIKMGTGTHFYIHLGDDKDRPDKDEKEKTLNAHMSSALDGSEYKKWVAGRERTKDKCDAHLKYLREDYLVTYKQEIETRLSHLEYAAALYGITIGVGGFYNDLKQGIYNEETMENTAVERLYLFAAHALIEDVDGIEMKIPQLSDDATEEEKETNKEAIKEVYKNAGRLKLQQMFNDVFEENFNTINSSNLLITGQEKMEEHIGKLASRIQAQNEWDFLKKNASVDIKYYNKLIDSMLYEAIKTLE